MRRIPWLVAVLAVMLAGCIVHDDGPDAYDFNGRWRFALSGCQAQIADVEIRQSGTALAMYSGGYEFLGDCDPWAAVFRARTDGPWGFWSFAGGATGPETMDGTYRYAEYAPGGGLRECFGEFAATRVAYRAADAPAGPGLVRKP